MPAKPFDPRRPSVYLDTSTLSHAFEGLALHAKPELREFGRLLPWVERVAHDANLIFSHIHLSELVEWDRGLALVEWLDELPLVWAHFPYHVRDSEEDHWLAVALEVPAPSVEIFAPSMLSTFRAPTPGLLGTATLVDAWHEERRSGALTLRLKQAARQWLAVFHDDRKAFNWPKVDPEVLRDRIEAVAAAERAELRRRATVAYSRLTGRNWRSGTHDADDIVNALLGVQQAHPDALPLGQVATAMQSGFITDSANRLPSGNQARQLDSSVADTLHAMIGAAYCDVFTCDRATSRWLCSGALRERFGLPPEVAWQGGQDGARNFVSNLTNFQV